MDRGAFSSVQLLSCVCHFETPWTAAHQASLSITNFWSLLKLMSIELVMPSNHLILCHLLPLLPSIFLSSFPRSFPRSSSHQVAKVLVSASALVLPMNIKDWFPLGWTGLISLQSKGLSRVFSNTTVQKHQFFSPKRRLVAAAAAKLLQSCLTLCDPIDGSSPGSPVPGILQARTLEWVAISFSKEWKWKVKVKALSRVWLCVTPSTAAHQVPPSMGFSRQEHWSGVPLPSPKRSLRPQ